MFGFSFYFYFASFCSLHRGPVRHSFWVLFDCLFGDEQINISSTIQGINNQIWKTSRISPALTGIYKPDEWGGIFATSCFWGSYNPCRDLCRTFPSPITCPCPRCCVVVSKGRVYLLRYVQHCGCGYTTGRSPEAQACPRISRAAPATQEHRVHPCTSRTSMQQHHVQCNSTLQGRMGPWAANADTGTNSMLTGSCISLSPGAWKQSAFGWRIDGISLQSKTVEFFPTTNCSVSYDGKCQSADWQISIDLAKAFWLRKIIIMTIIMISLAFCLEV